MQSVDWKDVVFPELSPAFPTETEKKLKQVKTSARTNRSGNTVKTPEKTSTTIRM